MPRDVQSLLHRLVRNHPPNIGLRNSELLSNFRWCEACLEGSANCILFADCQSHGRQFRPLTFSLRRWRFLTTPLLFYRHRNMQLLKFLVAEVLDRSWQIARQDMPWGCCGIFDWGYCWRWRQCSLFSRWFRREEVRYHRCNLPAAHGLSCRPRREGAIGLRNQKLDFTALRSTAVTAQRRPQDRRTRDR